jgi:hypothetical protein
MALTYTAARSANPSDKAFKLADEKGLFLLVHPNGSKYWRLKYRFAGKEKVLALGVYPEVRLAEARHLSNEVAEFSKANQGLRSEQFDKQHNISS